MKSFRDNPALRFLTPASPEADPVNERDVAPIPAQAPAQAQAPTQASAQAQRDCLTKRLPIMLDLAMYQGVCNEASRQRVSLAELVRRALTEYLRERE